MNTTAPGFARKPFWPIRDWPANLFGLRAPVDQRHYAVFGFELAALKYAVEALVIVLLTGKAYTPLDFVNPLVSSRERFTSDAPEWLGMGWVLWTLPFLWIAVSMSVRRAAYLRLTPWLGILVLAPGVNLIAMLAMAIWPDPEAIEESKSDEIREAYRSPPSVEQVPIATPSVRPRSGIIAALLGIAGGAGYLVLMVVCCVLFIGSYGGVLFFGTPVVTGALAAFCLNTPVPRSLATTVWHSVIALAVACFAFIALGLEGAICIVMALPIMIPLGLLGALVGWGIATQFGRPRRNEFHGLLGTLVVLPLFGAAEAQWQTPPTFEILTSVEIAASPETVWENVVQFSEIEDPPEWFFRLGFSAPLRARIEGSGVGAIRYCEFTTGAFVEPITAWEHPRRLAFDVAEQPEPMFELTPYRHIHPPHLDNSFRSERGEFLIVPLENGMVRLEGRTWYRLDIYPIAYWSVWTDALLHRIHERVLRQIKRSAECQDRTAAK